MRTLLVVALAALPLAAAIEEPVPIEGGLISGAPAWGWGVRVFKGVPYAAAPVGPLRWREPQPAAQWQGVREADHFAPACMQAPRPGSREGLAPMSEDCLYLNVWTAAKSAGDRLPVMVYIHGGGLRNGASSEHELDGSNLAKKGVVVVTINYRLGAFGYLAHPELTRESAHHSSGNYGLLDQIAALRWVQKNIAAFGGDPGRVTVFGHSGGSRSINFLMASPLAKGLFQRAIAQAHTVFGRNETLGESEASGVDFARAAGAASLSALRALPATALLALDAKFKGGASCAAVVDGWFLPSDVYSIFAAGKQNDVPLLTGSNADEGTSGAPPRSPTAFAEQARKTFAGDAEAYLKLYPASSEAEVRKAFHDAGRDGNLADHRIWLRLAARTGKSKSFWYMFSRVPPNPADRSAYHGAEIVYVFNNLRVQDWAWTDQDRSTADITSSYWVNFAAAADPNGEGLPRWPAWDESGQMLMNISDRPAAEPAPNPAAVDFFERRIEKSRLTR
jgi:para-nitrobenzyl esterase